MATTVLTGSRGLPAAGVARSLLAQPIYVFVIACLMFFSLGSPYFLAVQNFQDILVQSSTIGLIALGMTFVMIDGNIDLSVGSVTSLSACLAVGLQGYGILPAVLAALVAGALLGLLNGVLVWKTGVDSFIVTLGAMIGIRGIVFLYTREQSFATLNMAYTDFGSSMVGPIPTLGLLLLVAAAMLWWLLNHTLHGRNTFAVGGNRQAAINAGVRVGRHMVVNFVLVALCASLAGITLSSQMGAATPNLGRGFELWTITAVVLGGTKLSGGSGSIIGTLGGVFAIGILRNGMDLMHVSSFYVLVVMGVVLISVLFLDKQFGSRGLRGLSL